MQLHCTGGRVLRDVNIHASQFHVVMGREPGSYLPTKGAEPQQGQREAPPGVKTEGGQRSAPKRFASAWLLLKVPIN